MNNMAVSVLGAGSYGTALAITLARNGHDVYLWGHDKPALDKIASERCNQKFLPDVPFPDTLHVEYNLEKVIQASQNILVVIPSQVFVEVLNKVKPFLRPDSRVVWATKGLEPNTGRLLSDVAEEILGPNIPLAVVSGPTFAKELAKGLPTAITVASKTPAFMHDLQTILHCNKSFRVYSNSDIIGVQLGGAIKNVIAIGAGISDGMGFGANARTALITRGLVEMTRLGTAMGANSETFMGMAGLGDLVLTCTDNQSRNRRFGLLLGQGHNVEEANTIIEQVVEGFRNTKEVKLLAEKYHVDMPITEQIYQILYQGKGAKLAALDLLGRLTKDEIVY